MPALLNQEDYLAHGPFSDAINALAPSESECPGVLAGAVLLSLAPFEELVVDSRADLRPAQFVERKLVARLKRIPLPVSQMEEGQKRSLPIRRRLFT
jgi:hypothetical protein